MLELHKFWRGHLQCLGERVLANESGASPIALLKPCEHRTIRGTLEGALGQFGEFLCVADNTTASVDHPLDVLHHDVEAGAPQPLKIDAWGCVALSSASNLVCSPEMTRHPKQQRISYLKPPAQRWVIQLICLSPTYCDHNTVPWFVFQKRVET